MVVTEPSELVDDVSDLTVVDEDELLELPPEAPPDLTDEEADEDALGEVLGDDADDVESVCVCAACWVK